MNHPSQVVAGGAVAGKTPLFVGFRYLTWIGMLRPIEKGIRRTENVRVERPGERADPRAAQAFHGRARSRRT